MDCYRALFCSCFEGFASVAIHTECNRFLSRCAPNCAPTLCPSDQRITTDKLDFGTPTDPPVEHPPCPSGANEGVSAHRNERLVHLIDWFFDAYQKKVGESNLPNGARS